MLNTEWPSDEIRTLAESAGKPLEVATAETFVRGGWKARLGSYFADGALDVVRKLDVLAEREAQLSSGLPVRVRALISCKAFPPERSPAAYSVPKESALSFAPGMLSGRRSPTGWANDGASVGPLLSIEESGPLRLLKDLKLEDGDPLVAFDQFERVETKKKGQAEPQISFKRSPDGDRQLFTGIDSCVKAAIFWTQEDYQKSDAVYFAALNVPILLLSVPFWDVPIEKGEPGSPRIRSIAHQTSLLPIRGHTKGLMTLVCAREKLSEVIVALDSLLSWFAKECAILAG